MFPRIPRTVFFMILSKYFVFIHFPKTGGTFIRNIFEHFAPPDWNIKLSQHPQNVHPTASDKYFVPQWNISTGCSHLEEFKTNHSQGIQYHPTYQHIPYEYQMLPRIAFLRNPYDWYVSWYHFAKDSHDAFLNQLSGKGVKDFKSTILTIFDLDFIKTRNLGAYSWGLYYMFGDSWETIQIGRFEQLRENLLAILNRFAPVPRDLSEAIQTYPKVNSSQHEHYQSYYDEELREIIAYKDRLALEKFDYRF